MDIVVVTNSRFAISCHHSIAVDSTRAITSRSQSGGMVVSAILFITTPCGYYRTISRSWHSPEGIFTSHDTNIPATGTEFSNICHWAGRFPTISGSNLIHFMLEIKFKRITKKERKKAANMHLAQWKTFCRRQYKVVLSFRMKGSSLTEVR